jgi:hypothetical protein
MTPGLCTSTKHFLFLLLPLKFICIHCWVPVAHACNPSYSEAEISKTAVQKPAQINSSWDPISKKPFTKKDWWSGSRCRHWVQAPVPPKKKNLYVSNIFNWEMLYLYYSAFSFIFNYCLYFQLKMYKIKLYCWTSKSYTIFLTVYL